MKAGTSIYKGIVESLELAMTLPFSPFAGHDALRFLYSKPQEKLDKVKALDDIIQKLQNSRALRLGGDVSNEEALFIAQHLARHFRLNIYNNNEARAYQTLLKILPLNHTLAELKSSPTIITLGSAFIGCNPRLSNMR